MLQFQPKRVTEIRRALKLTQREFARRVGVSRQLVSMWEKGHYTPNPTSLVRLASMTGAKIESFFADTPHTPFVRKRRVPA